MRALLLVSTVPFAAQLAAQQAVRSPDHPLPPTVAVATTSYLTTIPERQPLPATQMPPSAGTTANAPAARAPRAPQEATSAGSLPQTVLFDRPRNGELWALGHDWKASFDGRGFTFLPFFGSEAPRNFPLRIELASATVGGAAVPLVAGEPRVEGSTVRTDRGGLVETVATDLHQVEQSFVFLQLPNRGAIDLDITMTSELAAGATADGLSFTNEHGSVGYRKAIAVDAAGATLALAIEWDGDSAHITIPAAFVARAKLPLVLDPIVDTWASIAPGQGQLQRNPDTATHAYKGLVVWQRQWSATDQDCFAWTVATIPGLPSGPGPTMAVDFTSFNWVGPRAASSAFAYNFLVVAQIDDQAGNTWIGGRLLTTSGSVGIVIDIERGGVVGLPGNNFRPDVGGDPYYDAIAYYNVVWEHETAPGNRDIYYKLVRQDGTLLTTYPSVLANLPDDESFPSISKGNGETAWHVAYQRQYPGFLDQDIWQARIDWSGFLVVAPHVIAGTVLEELHPCVSSRALPEGAVGGVVMVAYERVSLGQSDILCVVLDQGGAVVGGVPFDLSAQEAGGVFASRNQIFPEVDSDGVRFAVGYSEYTGSDYDTYITTLAFVPVTDSVRIDDQRVLLGGTVGVDDFWTRISAYRSGFNNPSPLYFVAGADIHTNDIAAWTYGGHLPGPFFTTRNTQCGSPSLIATFGQPVIGQGITLWASGAAPTVMLGGFPASVPLLPVLGCNCTLGVDFIGVFPSLFGWAIPPDPQLVGSTFAMQALTIGGSACINLLDFGVTVDFTIH